MIDHRRASATAVVLASLIAAAGMVAHNGLEFGPAFLLDPETLVPLAVFGLLARFALVRPASQTAHAALLAWALMNLVGGGILSGLPLDVLPFEPDESLGHYAAHVIYTLAEIPLVIVAARALRQGRPSLGAGDAG